MKTMSFTSLELSTYSPPHSALRFAHNNPQRSSSFVSIPIASRHASLSARSLPSRRFRLAALESEAPVVGTANGVVDFEFDSFLSVIEALCTLSSAALAIGFVASSRNTAAVAAVGSRLVAGGMVTMAVGISVGAWIRRRQWRRMCAGMTRDLARGGSEVNLLGRVEKLEEDLRNSAGIIRALSRQLEKLGIRFRVMRRALKDPIAETAALAQKNSQATQALGIHADILEKELGEMQKVLLAMQDQQRKQLELLLAIAKSGKLLETKAERSQEQERIQTQDSKSTAEGEKSKEAQQI